MRRIQEGRRHLRWIVAVFGLALAGCDNFRFTADLATDAPSSPDITSVEVNLLGLDFRREDGTDRTLEFTNPEVVNLLDLESGDPLRLFTDEDLPVGHYIGVRLLFDQDEDPNQVTTTTGEFPIVLADDAFAAVDFTVEESSGLSSGGSKALSLLLDLRQSLSFDGVAEEYTLTTHLRAVPTNDVARVQGTVQIDCTETGSLDTIGAVYLFRDHDVDPDDLDGSGVEPFATTRVTASGVGGGFQYALRVLPADDYTLAFTCRGNRDDVSIDDDLNFTRVQNLTLSDSQTLQRDLD
jgi:hypothetical protein